MISREFRPPILVSGNEETNKSASLTDELLLEGIVMRTCSNKGIYFSNAFMVKMEGGEKPAPEKYMKIHDKVFFQSYKKICCRTDLCQWENCQKSDSYAAEIVTEKFEELKNKTLPENDYIEQIMIVKTVLSDGKQGVEREGITYICRQTGYMEIAFPVRLYGRIMGAFIVGQIVTESGKDNWREITEGKWKKASYNSEE